MTLFYDTVPDDQPFMWFDLPDEIKDVVGESRWLNWSDICDYRPVSQFDMQSDGCSFGILRFQKKRSFERCGRCFEEWEHVHHFDSDIGLCDIYMLRLKKEIRDRKRAQFAISGFNTGNNAQSTTHQTKNYYRPKPKTTTTTEQKPQENLYPSAEVKIVDLESSFIGKLGFYPLVITSSLNANLKVGNKNSVNPTTFNKDGFKLEAKNEAVKAFSKFKLKNSDAMLASPPRLTLYNECGEYTVELTPTLISENEQQYTGTLSKDASIDDGAWSVAGNLSINITVTLSKEHPQGSWLNSLAYDLEHDIETIKNALVSFGHDVALSLKQAPPAAAAILVATVMLLAVPLGA